ncbi:cI repressor, partial [Streptococcus pneumoniae]
MDNLAQHVGEKIKFLRKENGWTQSVLAEKMSTSKQTISKYEKGIIKVNQDTIFKLADIFGVSIDSFFPPIIEEIATTSPVQAIYDQLTPPRQAKALTYLKKQLLEQKNENIVSENIISLDDYRESKTLPVIGVVTAGNGITQDDNLNMEKCFYTDEIPDDYDAIAYVVGNSMEPK